MRFTSRTWFLVGFLYCLSMMLIAAYFQFVEEMEPCPLCISQRIMVMAVGLVFLVGFIHNPAIRGLRIYSGLAALAAVGGGAISSRHVWIQNLPADEVPECGPGLSYVFENFPLSDTLKLMLSGTGECAEILWSFLGLTIPGWTLVAFISLFLLALSQLMQPTPS